MLFIEENDIFILFIWLNLIKYIIVLLIFIKKLFWYFNFDEFIEKYLMIEFILFKYNINFKFGKKDIKYCIVNVSIMLIYDYNICFIYGEYLIIKIMRIKIKLNENI